MADESWKCPYCQQVATLQSHNISTSLHSFDNGNKLGKIGIVTIVHVCPNSKCKEFTIITRLHKVLLHGHNPYAAGEPLLTWQLRPQSAARPYPDYIPTPILDDYKEACLIVDLSPKASATLARRCLQGMIRDFWKISKARLIDEINALEGKTDATTWKAIDAVRKIGNIGAHMETDINVIVDVEPSEAQLLIRLIEVLLEEWYIHRHERDEHMLKVIAAAEAKSKPPTTA